MMIMITVIMIIITIIIIIIISNSNWTEWNTIQGVIGRVISKLRARLLPELCDKKSNYQLIVTITKLEKNDSGLNYLTGLYIQLLS